MMLQADTIIPDGPVTQSLNRYSYVFNNPLSYTDPTGHSPNWFGNAAFPMSTYTQEVLTALEQEQEDAVNHYRNEQLQMAITPEGMHQSAVGAHQGNGLGILANPETDKNNDILGLTGNLKNDDGILSAYDKSVEQFGAIDDEIKLSDDLSFNFSTSGSKGFHKKVAGYLNSLNKNKYGKALLTGLADSGNTTRIVENLGQNAATQQKWFNFRWKGTTIAFDPRIINSPVAFENRKGNPVRANFNPKNILAHELFHAWQNSGWFQSGGPTIKGSNVRNQNMIEVNAVRYVNQIRKADFSQQFRVQYSVNGPRVDSFSDVQKRTR